MMKKLRTRRRIAWAKFKKWLWTRDGNMKPPFVTPFKPTVGLFGCRLFVSWKPERVDLGWTWSGRMHFFGFTYGHFDTYQRRNRFLPSKEYRHYFTAHLPKAWWDLFSGRP